jgi:hypothetical protein
MRVLPRPEHGSITSPPPSTYPPTHLRDAALRRAVGPRQREVTEQALAAPATRTTEAVQDLRH